MRRRRLALREIEEPPEPAASGPESDAELEEPNFNLLGFAGMGAGASGAAAATTESGEQQASTTPEPHEPSVFHLYQDGAAPEQMLQLAFMRRRAPRSLRDAKVRVEDEFVVPRPTLSLSDFLPSHASVPLEKLWLSGSAGAAYSTADADAEPLELTTRTRALESASKFFRCPREATDEDVAQWRRLAECDWRQAYQASQHHRIGISDVCYGLERCRSDALVQFVWEDLLVALVEQALDAPIGHEDGEESRQRLQPNHPRLEQLRSLLDVLVRHPSLATMPPKQFRAAVRAKNLRRVDPTAGAQLELELVTLFQRQRHQMQRLQATDVSQRRPS